KEKQRLKEEEQKDQARLEKEKLEAQKNRMAKEKLEEQRRKIQKRKRQARLAKAKQRKLEIKRQRDALVKARRKAQERARRKKMQEARKYQKLEERKKRTRRKNALARSLMQASTQRSSHRASNTSMHMIERFYGSEFNSFTGTQKKFIEDNLNAIYRITQRRLTRNGYPSVAVRTHQQGTQIVTFYLHPNGDISRLRLKRPLGYASLDKNTLRVIRIAYKSYPHPKTKTKITFYVEYSLR
ncbi:MAG: hypothetical protein DSZ12_02780, partial [Sulfurovum sp.]